MMGKKQHWKTKMNIILTSWVTAAPKLLALFLKKAAGLMQRIIFNKETNYIK